MNFFGQDIEVTKVQEEFYVNMDGLQNPELIEPSGHPLDAILPLMVSLKDTGWEGLYKRELIHHIVLDRTFNVEDMSIPSIVDVDMGRRFRLSTYRESGKIWACAVQLEQAAHGVFYDLQVANHLVPALRNSIDIPFRPRLVWQNDREAVVFFIPLEEADSYMQALHTEVTKMYVDKYCGKIQQTVEAVWDEQTRLRLV